MGFDLGIVAGNGEQGFGDAMPDVVADHIADHDQREQHTDARQDEVLPVVAEMEVLVEQQLDGVDGPVQNDGGAPGEHADHQAEQQKLATLGNMIQRQFH